MSTPAPAANAYARQSERRRAESSIRTATIGTQATREGRKLHQAFTGEEMKSTAPAPAKARVTPNRRRSSAAAAPLAKIGHHHQRAKAWSSGSRPATLSSVLSTQSSPSLNTESEMGTSRIDRRSSASGTVHRVITSGDQRSHSSLRTSSGEPSTRAFPGAAVDMLLRGRLD